MTTEDRQGWAFVLGAVVVSAVVAFVVTKLAMGEWDWRPFVGAILILALVGGLGYLYWRLDEERRLGPLTPDICAVCAKPLREKERVEVASDIDYSAEFGAQSAVLVAYCKKDAP